MRKIFLAITFALIAFTTSAQDSDQIRQWMRNMSRVEEKHLLGWEREGSTNCTLET